MQKKDTLRNDVASSMKEAFKCGECIHYASHSLKGNKEVCKKLGVRHFANAPKCFTPDVTKLAASSDQLLQVVSLFNNFSTAQRRILIGLLRGRKRKFSMGQKVYFRAVGDDYVSNYLSGFVLGFTQSGEVIIGGDPDKTRRGNSYTAILDKPEDILTEDGWKKRRQDLAKAGRLEDPKNPLRRFPKRTNFDDYEPVTIDTAPASWHTKEQESRRKKKRKE